jgi:SSS family transporter
VEINLGWIDTLVLITSVALAVFIGLRMRGKTSSVEAFLLGDRNLPWWAILGSIVATETSTATVLSLPGQAFGHSGMRFLQIAIGLICGRLIVVSVLLPLFFRGKLFSAYEVLDRRFGNATKYAASALFLITRNLGDGLRLFLAALVLEQMVGWSFIASAITIGGVTILYTYFGGMRSVVWNDCIQLVIYIVGGIATLFIVVNLIPGGWSQCWEYAAAHDKLTIFAFTEPESVSPRGDSSFLRWLVASPYSFWTGLIGGAFLTLGTHGTDQMMVQRYLSARSQRQAGVAIVASGVVVLFQFALFLSIGVLLFCFYNLVEVTEFSRADEVYAHFIVHHFPQNTGMVGLMLAAILAAAMSTLSSSLNASASALLNDFYLPNSKRDWTADQLLTKTRWLAIGFGVLQIVIGIWAASLDSTVISNALTIAGFAAGLLLGLFALAIFDSHATQVTALAGASVGLVVLLAAQFIAPVFEVSIAWTWLAMLGSTTTFFSGRIMSLLLGRVGDSPTVSR